MCFIAIHMYIILICVMCLWPGLVVDTRYTSNNVTSQYLLDIKKKSRNSRLSFRLAIHRCLRVTGEGPNGTT
jgi:hypothetical protein